MSWFPSGSWNSAIWQTPVSKVSITNSTPAASSSVRAAATSGHPQRQARRVRRKRYALCLRLPHTKRDLTSPKLGTRRRVLLMRQTQDLAVDVLGSSNVTGWDRDEIHALDLHHGTPLTQS